MAADQVVERRPGAAIGHEARLHTGRRGEQQASHMRRRADAPVRLFHALAVLLQIVHEVAQIVRREILLCDDHGRRVCGKADRLEIAFGIVFHARREHGS